MNYSTAVFLINKHTRAIACTYEEGEKAARTLFKSLDQSILPGDFVVVPTDTRHKMTVVKVAECDVDFDPDAPQQMAWIIGKVDRVQYEQTLAQEQQAIQTIKSAEMRRKREELAKNLLADKLDEMKALPIAAMNGDHKQETPVT